MYTDKVKDKIDFIKRLKSDRNVMLMTKLHRGAVDFYMKNKDFVPGEDILNKSIDEIRNSLGIILTIQQLKDIFALYPFQRINLSGLDEIDSSARDGLTSMMCKYVIGSEMVTFGDNLTDEEHKLFYQHLHEEAILLGYAVDSIY